MVSKGGESSGMANGRVLWDSRPLFVGGFLNMVPGAMLDLLTGGARVTITGATFYAVGRDYADVSPIDGVILEKLVDPDELVTPQSFGGTRGPSTALVALANAS